MSLGALVAVAACDPSGQVYEDLRLARLKVGESTEQDVRKLFGNPYAVRDVGGGKGLVYPLGPEGVHTLLIKIGPDGTYQGREDLLTRANFQRISAGMKQADVLLGARAAGTRAGIQDEARNRVGMALQGWRCGTRVRRDVQRRRASGLDGG